MGATLVRICWFAMRWWKSGSLLLSTLNLEGDKGRAGAEALSNLKHWNGTKIALSVITCTNYTNIAHCTAKLHTYVLTPHCHFLHRVETYISQDCRPEQAVLPDPPDPRLADQPAPGFLAFLAPASKKVPRFFRFFRFFRWSRNWSGTFPFFLYYFFLTLSSKRLLSKFL